MTRAALLAGCLALLFAAPEARAHDFRSSLLQLSERGPAQYAVTWTLRNAATPGEALRPVLPEHCRRTSPPRTVALGSTTQQSFSVDCGPQGLAGATLGVSGFVGSPSSVIVRIEHASGSTESAVLHAASPTLRVRGSGGEPGPTRVLSFARLGVEHIATGLDHVLFVLALGLWVRGGRRLAVAVTGFTFGHSATLALATLGWVRVPAEPIEVLIALSIAFVAAEWLRSARGGPATLSAQRPWLPALGFGLLHGLGFAGALTDLGVPRSSLPPALLGFNLGVEAGQLVIVGAILAARAAARRIELAAWVPRASAYAIGSVAAFWTLERLEVLWAG